MPRRRLPSSRLRRLEISNKIAIKSLQKTDKPTFEMDLSVLYLDKRFANIVYGMSVKSEAGGVNFFLCAMSVKNAHRIDTADLSSLSVILSVTYEDAFFKLCGIVNIDTYTGERPVKHLPFLIVLVADRTADKVEIIGQAKEREYLFSRIKGLGGGEYNLLPRSSESAEHLGNSGIKGVVPPTVDIVIFSEDLDSGISLIGCESEVLLPFLIERRADIFSQIVLALVCYTKLLETVHKALDKAVSGIGKRTVKVECNYVVFLHSYLTLRSRA